MYCKNSSKSFHCALSSSSISVVKFLRIVNNFHTNMKEELEEQWNDFEEAINILNLDN